jgi:hypothetical protein
VTKPTDPRGRKQTEDARPAEAATDTTAGAGASGAGASGAGGSTDTGANGAPRPSPTPREPAGATPPVEGPAAADPAEAQPGTAASAEPEARAVNGHADPSSGTLPPPWQRVSDDGEAEPPGSPVPNGSPTSHPAPHSLADAPTVASPIPPGAAAGAGAAGAAGYDTASRTAPPPRTSADDAAGGDGGFADARTMSMNHPGPGPRETESAGLPGMGGIGAPPGGFPMGWPRNRRPRQASLQLKRLDPWSVLKVALVLAVVLYLVWLIAVGVLYGVLDGIGVWDRLNGQYADLVAEQAGDQLISAGRVFGVAAIVGAVNSLLLAVAMSVGAFVYNVAADLVGGIEVTLSERD